MFYLPDIDNICAFALRSDHTHTKFTYSFCIHMGSLLFQNLLNTPLNRSMLCVREKHLQSFPSKLHSCSFIQNSAPFVHRGQGAGLQLFNRHSFVSLLVNDGINIRKIVRRPGHSKIEITWNTYSHLYPREEERAVNILNKIA